MIHERLLLGSGSNVIKRYNALISYNGSGSGSVIVRSAQRNALHSGHDGS